MKRLCVCGPDGLEAETVGLTAGSKADAYMVSRPEYELYALELPSIPENQITDALRFRLRAIYPGQPDSVAIDHERNGNAANGRKLFVMDTRSLEIHRRASNGTPLTTPSHISAALARNSDGMFILVTKTWISLDSFENGKLGSSFFVKRGDSIHDDLARLLGKIDRSLPRKAFIYTTDETSSEIEPIREASRTIGIEAAIVRPLSEAISKLRISQIAFFASIPSRILMKKRAIRGLIVLNAILLVAFARKYSVLRQTELDTLRSAHASVQAQYGAALKLKESIDALEKKYSLLVASRQPEAYDIVSKLTELLGPGVKIISLVVKGSEFVVEVRGAEAFSVLSRLERSSSFTKAKLHQSIPEAGGLERFTLSGSYHHDKE